MNRANEDELFRFFRYEDFDEVSRSLSTSLFRTRAITVSVNRGSIWPVDQNLRVCPPHLGLCSLLPGDVERVLDKMRELGANPTSLDILAAPLDMDPLLKIPNPSHANFSRRLTQGEASKTAERASKNIHRRAPEPMPS